MQTLSLKSKLLSSAALAFLLFYACKKDPGTVPSVPVNNANVNLSKGLLLYLPFTGTLADSSGNANQVTPVAGASLTYDEHGYANQAFGGTGNGERLQVTNNGSIKFDTALTISLNVMLRAQGLQYFISMADPQTGYGASFGLGNTLPAINNLNFGVTDTTAICGYFSSFSNSTNDTSSLILQPESWYNIIAIFNKGTLQTFVNGKLISTKTGGSLRAHICPLSKVIIGGWWDQDPRSLNGKLDEVRMYNRVLNADEIATLSKCYQPR